MRNFIQDGDVLTFTAPYAVASGDGFQVGITFAVAQNAAANGATVEGALDGVFELAAVTADTAAVGAAAYWDNAAKKITTTVATNIKVGIFAVVKTGTQTTATIRLNAAF